MKILILHNEYQQRGGEDGVVEAESAMLRSKGHEVVIYRRHNDELKNRRIWGSVQAAAGTIWSSYSKDEIRAVIEREKPTVAHFHNTFPLISPAAYYACAEAGVPVVQTLHNYRLLCPAATFLREGKVCESCLGRAIAWPGILRACYRDSRCATGAVAAMLATHRVRGTWQEKVSVYIALTQFAEGKFVEGGLPKGRITVKPNFVGGDFARQSERSEYALFVGRFSEEKGIQILLGGWQLLKAAIPLRLAGEGPLRAEVDSMASGLNHGKVEILGQLSKQRVRQEMAGGRFLVFPSVWYECFPLTIAEAFAAGLPVIASRLGAMAEIVEDGVTGLHFEPGNAADLAEKVQWAWEHPEEMQRMGRAARAEYEAKYTPERNYKLLIEIYQGVLEAPSPSVTPGLVDAAPSTSK